ncbi:UDP-glucose 4-epimerase [Synechococcus sp. MIT S9509]|uniref:UDP-glucose 4-epimerase GalE n=1 Tax=unclassified Synechococcus TaxID=2626047 RepID=UPI0007BB2546|nr:MULTISPECIES: UDP-glucose 4-epimerase GalE [unclassified Synechococcus]KZR85033.1 UDP-glucose 4-epimerase [Synechococcus sp. MIT S9504]KZR93769.1 UDP-glucose 4-epimerase [Synechococcus sp. MIT S9509]
MARLLITGGAGFIGSHTCVVLLQAGHNLLVLDNFSNSTPLALERVCALAQLDSQSSQVRLQVRRGDIRDQACLDELFSKAASAGEPIDAVIHFAGLKAVGESVREPLRYWDVNLTGSRCLLDAMNAHDCHTLVFSSSATLYGYPERVPIPETAPIQPINPYGHSKAAVEQLLQDLAVSAANQWRIACLRYFNPVGAHPSGKIGEDPLGTPNNLFPFLSQVAVGRRESLQVFGGDWPTSDGTCIRDYIHVMDLAEGHRAALDCLLAEPTQLLTLNLGSGQGASVLEVVHAFERACGRQVPYDLVARRDGDAAITVADPGLALQRLGWRTQRGLDDICRDGWAWQSANPAGYDDPE